MESAIPAERACRRPGIFTCARKRPKPAAGSRFGSRPPISNKRILSLSEKVNSMMATQVFKHHEYDMQCGAQAVDGGKFQPTLVISKNVWPTRPRTIAVRRGNFLTQEVAIASAQAQGLEWIAEYG
ncbi:MAG: hypothetical protein KGL43_14270 [Burkholderiales bacterium]|nr:hypothetical protein [Burkholderiales bacterium]MDE2393893.1 hypothetical protein [Burkholderiales bacterium]MDE2454754.1 hypothetical protein [Burkholderiales bacterium]